MTIDTSALYDLVQRRYLAGVHSITREVLQLQHGDTAVLDVQSSDQAHYGFTLTGVHIHSNGQDVEVGDPLQDKLADTLADDLSSLDWSRLLDNDRYGAATIEVTADTQTTRPTWLELNETALGEFLGVDFTTDPHGRPAAECEYDIQPSWGMTHDLGPEYGVHLSDILADLPDTVLTSSIGAGLAVDGLHSSDPADGSRVRVYVLLPGELRLSGEALLIRHLVPVDETLPGDAYPHVTRLVKTIVAVVAVGNRLIENMLAHPYGKV